MNILCKNGSCAYFHENGTMYLLESVVQEVLHLFFFFSCMLRYLVFRPECDFELCTYFYLFKDQIPTEKCS